MIFIYSPQRRKKRQGLIFRNYNPPKGNIDVGGHSIANREKLGSK
jgi:hypothetical protein